MNPEEQKFWDEFNTLLNDNKPKELEYRLHYNNIGEIISCSMQDHPDTNQYVVVTKDEYDRYFEYRVFNSRIKKIEGDSRYSVKLQKSTQGYSVVKNNAGLLIEPTEEYQDIEYYARRNY
jgi:hypothetical protein